ncbi:4-phosphoerythronate dehydrogenase PdxB [Bacteroidota bacterium]
MAEKIKIVADVDIPFLKGALEGVAEVVYHPGRAIDEAIMLDADALITRTRTQCNESLLKNSAVKIIAAASIGYDHIDTHYCEQRGIAWTNAPGCNSSSVEQYMLSVLLTLANREGFLLKDKTIGIVGVGHVGSKVARICSVLGMKVMLNDPPRAREEGSGNFVDIGMIKSEANIISMHVPLNRGGQDNTYHLVDDDFLSGLAHDPILINSSRGEVVYGDALKKALVSGQLHGAVLDVWEGEPVLDPELLAKSEIATPHIAGYSVDGKAKATGMTVQAISRFFGLGLDDWQPENLPEPPIEEIVLDGTGIDLQDLLLEVSNQTYDVIKDDAALRKDPGSFESLRASYPVRREPGAVKVRILNDQQGAGPILEELGYQVLSDNCM